MKLVAGKYYRLTHSSPVGFHDTDPPGSMTAPNDPSIKRRVPAGSILYLEECRYMETGRGYGHYARLLLRGSNVVFLVRVTRHNVGPNILKELSPLELLGACAD